MTAETARDLAEEKARADWGIDFAPFRPLEHTQQKRTTGRVDHLFVYERIAGNIGDSRFRLRLAVTGDELTEVAHYVHVPESFERRFQELRVGEQHDRRRGEPRGRRAVRTRRLHPRRAVAAAPALAGLAPGAGRRIRRRRADGRR